MPKRIPTPPLGDDTKYLSVVNPYPLHVRPAVEEEILLFARWMTACIPQEDLTAVYYRPVSPNLLIVEILKTCSKIDSFLGAHKWREFLKDPEGVDPGQSSRVYYCRYKSERDVQKHGWKRLDVQEFWFKDYIRSEGPFKIDESYPKTTFCEVPPETQAEFAPCRPLPVHLFPRVKPSPINRIIVPGSDLYVKSKEDGTYANTKAPTPTKAWSRVVSRVPTRVSTPSITSSNTGSVEIIMDQKHSLPVGLGAPPGLTLPLRISPAASFDLDEFEPRVDAVVSADTPAFANDITNSMKAVSLNDGAGSSPASSTPVENLWSNCDDGANDDENVGKLWEGGQPKRPTDWDKIICPEHKVKCSGTCEVVSKIKAQQKREMAKKTGEALDGGSGGGWREAKTRGRGRGQTRSNGGSRGYNANGGRRGGWH